MALAGIGGINKPDLKNLDAGREMSKKRIYTIGILVVLLGLFGSFAFFYYSLPFPHFPFQIPSLPKDAALISKILNQELPGYSDIEILAAKGNHQVNDPRLITLRVKFSTGAKPVTCNGQIFSFTGDPGARGIRWQTLECEGLASLIGSTQSVLTTTYEPNTVWYPRFYKCFNEKVASVLYYWVKQDKTILDSIGWPIIRTTVEEMLAGKKDVSDQVVLFDQNNIEIVDYDPELPADQKTELYYLECDGTIKKYVGKSYLEIQHNRGSIQDFQLANPLDEEHRP